MSAPATNGKPDESVWDFPRPPRLERVPWRIRVVHHGVTVVDAPDALRVLETSQLPAYYVHERYITAGVLRHDPTTTFCEWKGVAHYADLLVDGLVVERAAWTYPHPTEPYRELAGHWAFYAQLVDACHVDDEQVVANPGSFYGGWQTANVRGPFKGAPGTSHW